MKVKLKPTSVIIANLGLKPNGPVQKFFTNTCALHMDKYLPFDTGSLAYTAVLPSGNINEGNVFDNAIVYNQEYAKYVYYGLSKTGKPLNYQIDKHPQATSYWDKAMWTAERKQVAREVQNFVERGKKR